MSEYGYISTDEHREIEEAGLFFDGVRKEIQQKWSEINRAKADWHMAKLFGKPHAETEPEIPTDRVEEYAADMRRIEEMEYKARCAKEKTERSLWFAKSSGVPIRVRDAIGGITETKATERVKKWVDERHQDRSKWCLVLSADKGCGKSVAAGLFLWLSNSCGITFFNEKNSSREVLPTWWPISSFARLGGYDGKFDALCSHNGPIVIDDLGSEYMDKNGWFSQALDAFIDARYSEYRPTLITTNLGAVDFKARYNERVADRIREGGCFFEFAGASMRTNKPAPVAEVHDFKMAAAGEA